MFLPGNQIWFSWASDHDFAIVLEELRRVSADRLRMGGPTDTPSQGSPPAEVGRDMHGCVAAQRSLAAERKGRAEVIRESGGKGGFRESPDSNYDAPSVGDARYAAAEICIDIGRVEIPRRKSLRAKAAEFCSRGAASGETGGAFACLSLEGRFDAQTTEQDDEEATYLRRDSGGAKHPKSRKQEDRRQYSGNKKTPILHRPASGVRAAGDLLLDQAPAGAPSSWEDRNGRRKLLRISGGGFFLGYDRSELQNGTTLTARRRTTLRDQ